MRVPVSARGFVTRATETAILSVWTVFQEANQWIISEHTLLGAGLLMLSGLGEGVTHLRGKTSVCY